MAEDEKVELRPAREGMDLAGFSIARYTEVYTANENGTREKSIGFFKDEVVAAAYAQQGHGNSGWSMKTQPALVLTDGQVGFHISNPIVILNDEEGLLKVRGSALTKLTQEERKVLGLE